MQSFNEIAFQSAPVGIALIERRVIRACNQMFCTLTGFDKKALLNQSSRVFYASDEEFERVRDVGLKELRDGRDYSDMRLLRRSDGSSIWCRFRAQAMNPNDPLEQTVLTYAKVADTNDKPDLTAREMDVILGLRAGQTSKQIAILLGLSPRTVEDVRARLLAKFKSKNALEMLAKFTNLEN
ncbi:PAS and helix-turn-helix domain-containing protein [Actibacterium pelagium]|nr:PAS and helix-turn-helix domain-containing protein [Actibacterium pelagium]